MRKPPTACVDPDTGYIANIDDIRASEYPSLKEVTYLDHAGTTLYPRSLIEAFSADLTGNLFGNPHSASASSQLSSQRVDDVRLQVLRFFNADPGLFDVVFTSNATAAIKLVVEGLRDHPSGFDYAYHVDSHTSLIGVRELAKSSRCLQTMQDFGHWLHGEDTHTGIRLLAYPGQSNMTGARYSFKWARQINESHHSIERSCYTLFDAAGLASTSPIDLSDNSTAPDFTCVSFYKIFGFPDLGALILRKTSADVLLQRKYFGGGTVDGVAVLGNHWHAKRVSSIFASLEDGTLPFHSIIALEHALRVHSHIYGNMQVVFHHSRYLATELRRQMSSLRHANNAPVCQIYGARREDESIGPGPVISFNLFDKHGQFIRNSEVEKLAIVKNIHLRTGGLCNPGGTSTYLGLKSEDLIASHAAGHRCGNVHDLINGKPTGTIRASLGAMSSLADIVTFIDMLLEFYVDMTVDVQPPQRLGPTANSKKTPSGFIIESLTVFPIKSCAAFNIDPDMSWEVGLRGLAWDREWCLVHEGTLQALSQKKYPRMALLRPTIDLQRRILRIRHNIHGQGWQTLDVSLDDVSTELAKTSVCGSTTSRKTSSVCGEAVDIEHYLSPEVSHFFTNALGVPCTLARFPQAGVLRQPQIRGRSTPETDIVPGRSIALANESPILLVSRSSVNRLNEHIKARGSPGKAVPAESFRGNILIYEELETGHFESPYAEDEWSAMEVTSEAGSSSFQVLGPCQRCQMVSIDQGDASRRPEPFSTLAKTRKRDGRVWFGMHLALRRGGSGLLRVGDRVEGLTS